MSDVYSFGVFLLELITGQEEAMHIDYLRSNESLIQLVSRLVPRFTRRITKLLYTLQVSANAKIKAESKEKGLNGFSIFQVMNLRKLFSGTTNDRLVFIICQVITEEDLKLYPTELFFAFPTLQELFISIMFNCFHPLIEGTITAEFQ